VRHEPESEPGAGRERGLILHPAGSCEVAVMPSSTGMRRGKSVALPVSLSREGKGEAGFAQTKVRGSPPALAAIPLIALLGTQRGASAKASSTSGKDASVPGEVWGAPVLPSLSPPEPANPQVYPQHPRNAERLSRGAKNPAPLSKFHSAFARAGSLCLGPAAPAYTDHS